MKITLCAVGVVNLTLAAVLCVSGYSSEWTAVNILIGGVLMYQAGAEYNG